MSKLPKEIENLAFTFQCEPFHGGAKQAQAEMAAYRRGLKECYDLMAIDLRRLQKAVYQALEGIACGEELTFEQTINAMLETPEFEAECPELHVEVNRIKAEIEAAKEVPL